MAASFDRRQHGGGGFDADGGGARTFRKFVDSLRTYGDAKSKLFFAKCNSSARTLFAFARVWKPAAGRVSRIQWQCAVFKNDTMHDVARWDAAKIRAHVLSPGHLDACREWAAYTRTKDGTAASFAFTGLERSNSADEVADPHTYCLSMITYSLVNTMQPFNQAPIVGELVSTICRYILGADLHNSTPAQFRRLVNTDNGQSAELLRSLARLQSICAVKKPMPCSRKTAMAVIAKMGDVMLKRTVNAVHASECFTFSMDATKDLVSR